jgi:Fe2+ transport system protein FeoA
LSFQNWLDKGAYEDYSVIIEKKPEDMDPKEKDTMAIVNYLQGRKKVKVDDILAEAGAERLRVYLILFELEQSAWITVLERAPLGQPIAVKINPEALK